MADKDSTKATAPAAIERYFVKEPHASAAKAITRINGELVNLSGKEVTEKIPGKKGSAPKIINVRGVLQADLVYAMEVDRGNWSHIIGDRQAQA